MVDRYTQWVWSGLMAPAMISLAVLLFGSDKRRDHVTGAFSLCYGLIALLVHVNLLVGLAVNP